MVCHVYCSDIHNPYHAGRFVFHSNKSIFVPCMFHELEVLNTSYLTDSYISFTLNLEYWEKICSNRFIRSSTYGKREYFWNSSMRKPFSSNSFYLLVLRKITNSVTKTTIFPHGGKSEIFFLPYVLDLIDLLEQKFCWASNLRVKLMFESVMTC